MGSKIGANGLTYLIGGFSLSLVPGTLSYNTLLEFTRGHIGMGVTALIITAATLIFFTTLSSFRVIVFGKPKAKIEYIKEVHGHGVLRIPGIVLALCILILGIVVLLGANGIALTEQYKIFEEWFNLAASTICKPWGGFV